MSHLAPQRCPTTYCHGCGGRGSWFVGVLWWRRRVTCDRCGGTGNPTAEDIRKYEPIPPSAPPPQLPRTTNPPRGDGAIA